MVSHVLLLWPDAFPSPRFTLEKAFPGFRSDFLLSKEHDHDNVKHNRKQARQGHLYEPIGRN
jgi:hypothetical protein